MPVSLDQLKEYAKDPNRIFSNFSGETVSYAELVLAIYAIRNEIFEAVPSGAVVLLIGDKERYLLAGLFAAVMSGHPYVMVSSAQPVKRVHEICKICRAEAVLDFSGIKENSGLPCFWSRQAIDQVLKINEKREWQQEMFQWADGQTIAYYFTSGSTGTPKGIKITYGNVCSMLRKRRFINEHFLRYTRNEQPAVLDFIPYSFIASVPTVYSDILTDGAKLYPVDSDLLHDYSRLIKYILDCHPDHFTCTPSFLNICLKDEHFCQQVLPELQAVFTGGAVLSADTVKEFKQRFDCELVNVYGASETTASAIYMPASLLHRNCKEIMPSGFPLPETEVIIADENGNPVPQGETGELLIVSPSICGGYTNGDETSFFMTGTGMRGFRTGDLFRETEGLLWYMGRKDQMVKVGGRRVEIFEIERRLIELETVRDATVVPCRKNGEICFLVAFVEMRNSGDAGITATLSMKKELRKTLPSYAVPQVFLYPEEIPKNQNQKPDRKYMEALAFEATFGRKNS